MPRNVCLYRYTHDEGGSKDWAYPVDRLRAASALEIYHGRTGRTLRLKSTPASACKGGSPIEEAWVREKAKRAKGYVFLGQYTLADNRRDLTPVVQKAGATLAPQTGDLPACCWYWRLSEEAPHEQAFLTACQHAAQTMADAGWVLPACEVGGAGIAILAMLSKGEFQGVLERCEENRPLMAFWLLLARADVGLTLANEAGERVLTWPGEVPIAEETLVELGLKPRDTRQLLAAVNDRTESWYFE